MLSGPFLETGFLWKPNSSWELPEDLANSLLVCTAVWETSNKPSLSFSLRIRLAFLFDGCPSLTQPSAPSFAHRHSHYKILIFSISSWHLLLWGFGYHSLFLFLLRLILHRSLFHIGLCCLGVQNWHKSFLWNRTANIGSNGMWLFSLKQIWGEAFLIRCHSHPSFPSSESSWNVFEACFRIWRNLEIPEWDVLTHSML